MSRKTTHRVTVALIVTTFVWFVFALVWAWCGCWKYNELAPGADYWGQVAAIGFGLIGNTLLFLALMMQRSELELQREQSLEQSKESAKTLDAVRSQAEAMRALAEATGVQAEFSKITPLVALRAQLLTTYYGQVGKTDVSLVKKQLSLVDGALGEFVERSTLDALTRQTLQRMVGSVDLDARTLTSGPAKRDAE